MSTDIASPDCTVPAGITLTLIVARANNGVIGKDNQLVWSIPEELRHFKDATMGHTLLMGRKTWASIGRPLPGRRMIVVSRAPGFAAPGCEVATSVPAALELAATASAGHPHPSAQVFVAGGAQIYRQTLPLAHRVLLTQVDLAPDGDVTFDWDPAPPWHCQTRSTHQSRTGINYEIQDWRRASV